MHACLLAIKALYLCIGGPAVRVRVVSPFSLHLWQPGHHLGRVSNVMHWGPMEWVRLEAAIGKSPIPDDMSKEEAKVPIVLRGHPDSW